MKKPNFLLTPEASGNLSGLAVGAVTALAMFKTAKGQSLGVKIGIPIVAAIGTRILVKRSVETQQTKRMNKWLLEQQFATPTAPAATYNLQLPGGSTPMTTQAFNPDLIADAIHTAYNPDGWTSDETKMLQLITSVPPTSFRLIANAYFQQFGRNLLNDLNEQLDNWIHGIVWLPYRALIT